jgi:hypothetical protein
MADAVHPGRRRGGRERPIRRPDVLAVVATLVLLAFESPVRAQPAARYLEDFEFLEKTVEREGAAVRSKKIPWKKECARLRPRFARCESDAEHVRNVMELLAVLRDSHTGVTRHGIPAGELPSKWDGLFGAGLWIGWDEGRLLVQGLMEKHPVGSSLPPGSVILGIGGEPAWLAMERESRRIRRFTGVSSDASLFASMANRMLPFGERRRMDLEVLTPEGKIRKVTVPRWGPGGKAFYPSQATLPEGVAWKEGATSALLEVPWCRKLGYLRITGSMDAATVSAFHAAFDALRGMEALLLDCRGMGGGGDGAAWEMAGRFFAKGIPNGSAGRLEPSGDWQFDGPVVMLQDETEVSSAETFTWAVSETERVVSVGRPTGGWAIIPRGFECPSGLVSFRLGVTDRATPIRGVKTEGIGWPPDVAVPYGPAICARPDPVREIGMDVLRVLHAGVPRDRTIALFAGLVAGEIDAFRKDASKLVDQIDGWSPDSLARLVLDDLRAALASETQAILDDTAPAPDVLGASRRLEALTPRARAAGLGAPLKRLESAIRDARRDADAQKALLDALDAEFTLDEKAKKAFLRKHGKTRLGKVVESM